jgi:hypothetical protein
MPAEVVRHAFAIAGRPHSLAAAGRPPPVLGSCAVALVPAIAMQAPAVHLAC